MNLPHGDFDSGPGYQLAMAPCYACGQLFGFNPHTVVSVPIDPVTGLPPDVAADGTNITPDPEAVSRAVSRPLDNACARRAGVPESELAPGSTR